MSRLRSYVTDNMTNMNIMNGWKKEQFQGLTCVQRAYGLGYLSAIHTVLFIQDNPASSATPTAQQTHKEKINRRIEKQYTRKKTSAWIASGGGPAVQSWIS